MERKLAVVTGASSGIGYELAIQCAKNGFDVISVAENTDIYPAADQVSILAKDAWVNPLQIDLAKAEGVEELHARIREIGRPVDALLLNAGVGVSGSFTSDIPLEADLNLISLNITSIVHLAKLELPAMVARGQGKVLITASIAALMPGPYYATYAASKAFLLSFSEALQTELKDKGVTVTALMPGPTNTHFFERAGMEDTKAGKAEKDHPAVVAEQGFQAMMAGKDKIVAGSFMNKVQSFSTRFLSEQQKAEIHKKQVKPFSAA